MDLDKLEKKILKVFEEKQKEGFGMMGDLITLASDPNTPIDILEILCNYDDLRINCNLLNNSSVTGQKRTDALKIRRRIEEEILQGKREYEISILIADSNTSTETLEKIYNEKEKYIKIIASFELAEIDDSYEKEEPNPEEYRQMKYNKLLSETEIWLYTKLINNSNTPIEIIEYIVKNYFFIDYDIDSNSRFEQLDLARTISNCKRLSINLKEKAKSYLISQYGKEYASERKESPTTDLERKQKNKLEELMSEWDEEDYIEFKEDEFNYDGDREYYINLASNPFISEEIALKICNIDNDQIIKELIKNPGVSNKVILKIIDLYEYSVNQFALDLLNRKDLPDSILERISQSNQVKVLLTLIGKIKERSQSFLNNVSMNDVAYVALHRTNENNVDKTENVMKEPEKNNSEKNKINDENNGSDNRG